MHLLSSRTESLNNEAKRGLFDVIINSLGHGVLLDIRKWSGKYAFVARLSRIPIIVLPNRIVTSTEKELINFTFLHEVYHVITQDFSRKRIMKWIALSLVIFYLLAYVMFALTGGTTMEYVVLIGIAFIWLAIYYLLSRLNVRNECRANNFALSGTGKKEFDVAMTNIRKGFSMYRPSVARIVNYCNNPLAKEVSLGIVLQFTMIAILFNSFGMGGESLYLLALLLGILLLRHCCGIAGLTENIYSKVRRLFGFGLGCLFVVYIVVNVILMEFLKGLAFSVDIISQYVPIVIEGFLGVFVVFLSCFLLTNYCIKNRPLGVRSLSYILVISGLIVSTVDLQMHDYILKPLLLSGLVFFASACLLVYNKIWPRLWSSSINLTSN